MFRPQLRTNLGIVSAITLALLGVACSKKDEAPAPVEASAASAPAAASAPGTSDEWAWADSSKTPAPTAPAAAQETRDITTPTPVTQPPAPTAPKPRQPKPKPPTNVFEPAPDEAPYGDDKPAPAPVKVAYTAPTGTAFDASLDSALSSDTAQVGQTVTATLGADITDGAGHVVLPRGTRLVGTVTECVSAKKVKKKSSLAYQFTKAELPDGTSVPMAAGQRLEGKGYTKKDAAIIGGSAAGGAVLGGVLGGDAKGAAAGAIIGGAIGSGVSMSKKGEEVELPAGTVVPFKLEVPVTVER